MILACGHRAAACRAEGDLSLSWCAGSCLCFPLPAGFSGYNARLVRDGIGTQNVVESEVLLSRDVGINLLPRHVGKAGRAPCFLQRARQFSGCLVHTPGKGRETAHAVASSAEQRHRTQQPIWRARSGLRSGWHASHQMGCNVTWHDLHPR